MSSRKSKLPVILGAAVVALLGFNAYLLVNKFKVENAYNKEISLKEEAQAELERLEEEYNTTVAKLDESLAENQELGELIEKQKEELSKSKSRIQGLLRDGQMSREELEEAKIMIAGFAAQRTQYMSEIAELKTQNASLTSQKKVLTAEKEILAETVEEQRVIEEDLRKKKSNLEEAKANLEEEKAVLITEKTSLESAASSLRANKIKISAIKVKNNGEEREVKSGKRADKIKACFEVLENSIAKSGPQTIYMRIIDVSGATLAIEALGSGEFKDKASGQNARYTISETIDYENASTNMCMYWTSEKGFEKGRYTIELYNNGYIMGRETLLVK